MAISATTNSTLQILQQFQQRAAALAAANRKAAEAANNKASTSTNDNTSAQDKLAGLLAKPAAKYLAGTLSDDKAKALSDQLQKTRDSLKSLDQAKQNFVQSRKSAALDKLEQARRKLALLRQLGGDPKTVARQAKAIAQEIRAAAKDYADAVQADPGDDATSTESAGLAKDAPSNQTSASPGTATNGSSDAAATDQAGAQQAASSDAPAVAGETNQTAAGLGAANAKPVGPEAARQNTVRAYQDAASRAAAKGDKAQAERENLEKFRDAARDVKSLIQDAARKLKAKHGSDVDAQEAEKAGAAADKAVEDLADVEQASQFGTAGDVSDDSVAGFQVDVAAPAVSILV